jgi:toxin CptA
MMDTMIGALALLVAVAAAALMGVAIQRGATCTVAAVDELVGKRKTNRLIALLEAALWVGGGLLVAQALHQLPKMPGGFVLTGWTVLGGALLGLGAWVNRACVFGAIARFGSGDWAYAATPVGFWLGCLSVGLFAMPAPQHAAGSPVLGAPAAVTVAFVVFALWRGSRYLSARRWTPQAATTVIGLTFLATLLLAGGWAYTELLSDLARGRWHDVGLRTLLALALLGGAVWGGWTAGRLKAVAPTARELLRCLIGGVLMGWGSLLIPGGNDGLILVGMPLLWPYAWVAFATMGATIAAAIWLQQRLHGRDHIFVTAASAAGPVPRIPTEPGPRTPPR